MSNIARMGPYETSDQHETMCLIRNGSGVVVCEVRGMCGIVLPDTPQTGDMAERIVAALNLIEGIPTHRIAGVRPVDDEPKDKP